MELSFGAALSHWPFLAFSLICAVVIQVAKATIWTKARAEHRGRGAGFFWWGRKTLPLHPVVVGALLGLIPGAPGSAGVETPAALSLYYALAGLVSTWLFAVIKGLAKQRGIELPPLVAPSVPAPPPNPDLRKTPLEIPKSSVYPPPLFPERDSED